MKAPHIPALTELNGVAPVKSFNAQEEAVRKRPPPKYHSRSSDVIDMERAYISAGCNPKSASLRIKPGEFVT